VLHAVSRPTARRRNTQIPRCPSRGGSQSYWGRIPIQVHMLKYSAQIDSCAAWPHKSVLSA